jgi:hypothetical protein
MQVNLDLFCSLVELKKAPFPTIEQKGNPEP